MRIMLAVGMLAFGAAVFAQSGPAVTVGWAPPNGGSGRGSITLVVDSYSISIRYGELSTATSLAGNFGGIMSLDSNSPVWAKGNLDGSITMKARSHAVSNMSVSISPDAGSPAVSSWASINVNPSYIQQPTVHTITKLSLPEGPAGMGFTISGQGFGATQGASTVKIGDLTATVLAWSDTVITVQVPQAALPNGSFTAPLTVNTGAQFSGTAFSFKIDPPFNCQLP